MKKFGVKASGLICPIIREGDNLEDLVVNVVYDSIGKDNIKERDIIGITESIVARAKGTYCTVDDIAKDIESKYGKDCRLIVYKPIYSRNRFAIILRGIARACSEIVLYYGSHDEVGNNFEHEITKVNYINYYREICESENCIFTPYFEFSSIRPGDDIGNFLNAGLHNIVVDGIIQPLYYSNNRVSYTLKDILSDKTDYGVLGSNKVDEEKLKLFPKSSDCKELVYGIQNRILKDTGKKVEVLVYGDGCYKDLDTGIWEMADPVCSPGYTDELESYPKEVKLKYLADDKFKDLSGKDLEEAIKNEIANNSDSNPNDMKSQGTTPRKRTNLLASLCDLVSGSGDKGTPVIYISGYFDNYAIGD